MVAQATTARQVAEECEAALVLLRIFTEPQIGATYDDLLAVAKATEEGGFDAFFRSDHYMAFHGDGLPGSTDAWMTLATLGREVKATAVMAALAA